MSASLREEKPKAVSIAPKRQQAKAAARYGLPAGANPRSRIERPRSAVASSSRGGLRAKLAADLPMKTDRDGRSINDMWARPDGNVRPPAGRSKTAKGRTPGAPSRSSDLDQAHGAMDRTRAQKVAPCESGAAHSGPARGHGGEKITGPSTCSSSVKRKPARANGRAGGSNNAKRTQWLKLPFRTLSAWP
jgi:hypothetical protein